MSFNVWEFLNVHINNNNEAESLLNELFSKMLISLAKQLDIDIYSYKDFESLVESNKDSEKGYFFRWLEDEGFSNIKNIELVELEDTDEVVHFLRYRLMLLEMDIENDLTDNLLMSFAETLTTIDEFIGAYLEQAATSTFEITDLEESLYIPKSIYYQNHDVQWKYEVNPADIQQDFCYY